jgi:hypothetical protein
MSDCFCTKNYQCLGCEKAENRKQAIAENRALTRKVAECGTRAGYNRHLKLKEPTCQPCKDAQKEAVQRWQRNAKELING